MGKMQNVKQPSLTDTRETEPLKISILFTIKIWPPFPVFVDALSVYGILVDNLDF